MLKHSKNDIKQKVKTQQLLTPCQKCFSIYVLSWYPLRLACSMHVSMWTSHWIEYDVLNANMCQRRLQTQNIPWGTHYAVVFFSPHLPHLHRIAKVLGLVIQYISFIQVHVDDFGCWFLAEFLRHSCRLTLLAKWGIMLHNFPIQCASSLSIRSTFAIISVSVRYTYRAILALMFLIATPCPCQYFKK